MFNLGRNIDFAYKTNKIIVIVSIVVAALGWILTGNVWSGLYIGGGSFLTWALSREIDPKHDYSSFLAVGFSLLNLFYFENIQLLIIFWVLLLIRIASGITGKESTAFDIFSVLGLTIYISINYNNSIYLIIFVLAMAFIFKIRQKRNVIVLASLISLGFFIAESFFMSSLSFNYINYINSMSILTITILCLSFILFWFLSKDEIRDDRGNVVKGSRILASQSLYSAAVLLLFFFGGININNLIVYLSVIVGVTIYYIVFKVLKKNNGSGW